MSFRTVKRLVLLAALAVAVTSSGMAVGRSLTLGDAGQAPVGERTTQETVWFQGFLADEATGDPVNATYSVVARIYDAAAAGVLIWGPETHAGTTITEGWFNVELGSIAGPLPPFNDPPYYLSLQVNGEFLTPRLKLASVPSAIQSATADLVPFFTSYSGANEAFQLIDTNTMDYDALYIARDGGTDAAFAIYGRNSGPEAVIRGWQNCSAATALAPVALFDINWSANDSPVIDAGTPGAGPIMIGSTGGLYGVEVYADAADGISDAAAHVVHAAYDGGARSAMNVGVYGESVTSDIWGVGGEFHGSGVGVAGYAESTSNIFYYGVYGSAAGGTGTNVGVYGTASDGTTAYAGYFSGDVDVNGTLTKSAGSFKIDHPLDPANKYLSHSFVESPDMKNVYDGVVALDSSGEAWVELPEWFEALNQDFRYQLTAIGAPGPNLYIADEVSGNRFHIAGGEPGMRVSWQVTGIRHDKYAEAHRIPVEEPKSEREMGQYRNPELYGMPESAGVMYDPRMEQAQPTRSRRPERPQASEGVDPENQ